ncbi:hypothetical protein C8R46DRAFT_1308699 [Mycena filopes]|nr:hypothetical protein C8R46DRAFT_1308699 [Mycena filopes]
MISPRNISTALIVASLSSSTLGQSLEVCTHIQRAVSSASQVSFPGSPAGNFQSDLSHWVQSSSSSSGSACSVEPGTANDVSILLQILGQTRTPFAVKGGGHTGNPGFSSTTAHGVQISMARFSTVIYDKESETVEIGPGLIWDEVYAALEPYGVVVAGGRVAGVGVAGFILGGGYSWLTDQVGLTVDTVTAYARRTRRRSSHVTPTTPARFVALGIFLFYDGPSQPKDIFDDFLAIPSLSKDVGPRTLGALVKGVPTDVPAGTRGYFHGVTLTGYSPKLIDAIANETTFWGARLDSANVSVGYHFEPFLESIYTHNDNPTAFPPFRSPRTMPLNLQFTWPDARSDAIVYDAMFQSATHLTKVALLDSQTVAHAPVYPNYALFGTPLTDIYGSNLPRLKEIKARVDSHNIMGLTGGWKF